MGALLGLGLLALIGLLLFGRIFLTASPATLAKALKGFAIGLLFLVLLVLVVSGRMSIVLASLAALTPWLFRAIQLHSAWKYLKGQFGGGGGAWKTAGSGGNTSHVETAWLRMSLDHDSGHLDGAILRGGFQGRRLCDLTYDEALLLYRDVQGDAQSAQLMEAWLDRNHPDWRDQAGAGEHEEEEAPSPPPGGSGRMTREEALSVLGLKDGATPDDIRAAHRRLMMTCHPDHGGSDWLAARLNQAKEVLMG